MNKVSEFDKFLKELSDHELSIFIRYRFDSFMSNSRKKIVKEIERRKLTLEQIETFFKQRLDSGSSKISELCPRCGSDKLFIETDYDHRLAGNYTSVDVAIDTNRCRLCGYCPSKETSKNLFERIKRIFKNNKTERIIKWDTW